MDEGTHINLYTDSNQVLLLKYIDGELVRVSVTTKDMVLFDGLKQLIPLYETDINKQIFHLLK